MLYNFTMIQRYYDYTFTLFIEHRNKTPKLIKKSCNAEGFLYIMGCLNICTAVTCSELKCQLSKTEKHLCHLVFYRYQSGYDMFTVVTLGWTFPP